MRDWQRSAERSRRSAPPMVMLPPPTSQKEAMSFAMVDLPLPEGPTRAFTVPSRKVRSMPWSTSVSP